MAGRLVSPQTRKMNTSTLTRTATALAAAALLVTAGCADDSDSSPVDIDGPENTEDADTDDGTEGGAQDDED
ncbi:hypothetical protein EDD31_0087 [Bogoriella caseilytica]|uniref:Uncharacterized protein n=2 Tax=Bogoriella caseilytica TaxID=56055 RepID=A0A3N2B8Z0_9MICO|nr:hypothetical protein EDD31_0087 [Bogoriella caseilytica]